MTGIKIGNVSHQAVWAELAEEPVFVLVHEQDAVALVTLDYLRDAAQEVYDGDRDMDDVYRELYIKSPDSSVLERVTLGFAGKPGALKLTVIGETAVEWTFNL